MEIDGEVEAHRCSDSATTKVDELSALLHSSFLFQSVIPWSFFSNKDDS